MIKTVGKFILLFHMVGTLIFYCGSVLFMGIPTDSILSMVRRDPKMSSVPF